MAIKESANKKKEKNENESSNNRIYAPEVELMNIRVRAIGISSLLLNNGSKIYTGPKGDPSLKGEIQVKEKRNPKAEYEKARYTIDKKTDGVPAYFFKEAMISVAHTIVENVSKTLVRKSLWIIADYQGWLNKIEDCIFPPPMDERIERVGAKGGSKGSPQLRYRPRYDQWTIPFTVEYLKGIIDPQNLINLLTIAGISAGIGEHRSDKGGEWGRFKVIGEDQYKSYKKTLRLRK